MSVAKPDDKVSTLEKQLADITSKLSNITNRAGTTNNGGGKKSNFVKKTVTFNKYCSLCGVVWDHDNDSYPPAKRQSWHKKRVTWDDKKGGNTSKDYLWGKTKKVLVWQKN